MKGTHLLSHTIRMQSCTVREQCTWKGKVGKETMPGEMLSPTLIEYVTSYKESKSAYPYCGKYLQQITRRRLNEKSEGTQKVLFD